MQFRVGKLETRKWSSTNHKKVTSYLTPPQQPVNTIAIHTDYAPEEMTTRLKAIFRKGDEEC